MLATFEGPHGKLELHATLAAYGLRCATRMLGFQRKAFSRFTTRAIASWRDAEVDLIRCDATELLVGPHC
jgi:hypothetical protein